MAALVCKTLLRRPKTSDISYIYDLSSVNEYNGTDTRKLKMKVLLCLMLPDVRKRTALFQGLHDSPFYHFNKSSMKTQRTGEP
jgi:hypothetical protein